MIWWSGADCPRSGEPSRALPATNQLCRPQPPMIRLPQYERSPTSSSIHAAAPMGNRCSTRVADVLGHCAPARRSRLSPTTGVTPDQLRDALDAVQPDRNLLADLDHIFVDRSLGAVQVRSSVPDSG